MPGRQSCNRVRFHHSICCALATYRVDAGGNSLQSVGPLHECRRFTIGHDQVWIRNHQCHSNGSFSLCYHPRGSHQVAFSNSPQRRKSLPKTSLRKAASSIGAGLSCRDSFPQPTLEQQPNHAVVGRILERILKRLVVHVRIALELLEQQVAHAAHLVLKPHRLPLWLSNSYDFGSAINPQFVSLKAFRGNS